MLRPAGDMGGFGGGGRPPVNIQVNFVPGDVSAFKAGTADTKAMNAELERSNALLRERNALLGGGGGGAASVPGSIPGGGTSRGVATPGSNGIPVFIPPRGGGAVADPGNMRPIDILQANIERRRQGLPDLPDPTIAAAAANVAAGGAADGIAAGRFGGLAAGALGVASSPWTILGGSLVALAASRTPQGQEAIGGWGNAIGSTVESYTRPNGFLSHLGSNLTMGLGGPVARMTGLSAAGGWAIEPWRDSARTAENLSAAEERARWMRHQFRADDLQASIDVQGQLRTASIPSVLDGTIAGAQQANQSRIDTYNSALNRTATDDPQSANRFQGKERAEMLGGLIEARKTELGLARQAHEETVGYWRTTLQGLGKELDMRVKATELAEKEVNARTASYAGQSPSQLRALERAYDDATDGDGKLSKRNQKLLNMDGSFGDLPELQRANRENLEKYAPDIAARLQKPLDEAKAAQEATQKAVEDFSEQMAGVQDRSAEAVRKIADETIKAIKDLEEQRNQSMRDMVDELRSQVDAKSNEPSSVPGGA